MTILWKASVELTDDCCAYRRLTLNRITRYVKEANVNNGANWLLEATIKSLALPMLKAEIIEATIEPVK